jgi:hypothetical protein
MPRSPVPVRATCSPARRHNPEVEASPALDQLRNLDPDTLTPRAALDALYELKRLLKS